MLLDQSGIGFNVRKNTRIAYFVADSSGNILGMRDCLGNIIKNEFADELSALEAAAKLAEADLKYSVRNRSIYVVHKGIVRDTSPDWKPG